MYQGQNGQEFILVDTYTSLLVKNNRDWPYAKFVSVMVVIGDQIRLICLTKYHGRKWTLFPICFR